MLSFPGNLKIFIALEPCDMRAGINTLHGLVADKLKEEVKSGALFVFTNKRRRLLKILYFDGIGRWLMTNVWRKASCKRDRGQPRRASPSLFD